VAEDDLRLEQTDDLVPRRDRLAEESARYTPRRRDIRDVDSKSSAFRRNAGTSSLEKFAKDFGSDFLIRSV
jgi:hypothetical protein